MRRLAFLVVLLGAAPAGAAEVEVSGLPIVVPCDEKPAIKGGLLTVDCGGVKIAAEVGQFTVEQQLAKISRSVPEDKQARQELPLGGKKNVLMAAELGANAGVLFVVEDIEGDKDLALTLIGPVGQAEASTRVFQQMTKDTMAAIARRRSGAGNGRVPFKIVWSKKLGVSYKAGALRFARDRNGNLPLLLATRDDLFPLTQEIHAFESGGDTLRPIGMTVRRLAAPTGLPPFSFSQLDADADGNLFVGVSAHLDAYTWFWDAFAWVERSTGKVEAPATLKDVLALGDGSNTGGEAVLRAAPDGSGWLFVRQGTGKMRFARVRRTGPGSWTREELSGFDTKGLTPKVMDLGSPDASGGYVFHVNKALWRIGPDGKLARLCDLDIPPRNTNQSRLVVTPRGDIWVAFSMETSTIASTHRLDSVWVEDKVQAWVAGESSWLRIRFAGGKPSFAAIKGDDLLAALKARTPNILAGSNILKTHELRLDHKSGGLVAFDVHNDVLFVVELGE